ncbi:MAG: alpha/beta fold hydrolase [Thermoanaerobaculia bacterium]
MTVAASALEKSTTDRLRQLPVPVLLRAGMRIVAGLSPDLAARAARRLFFTPPRTRPRAEQREILARGRRLDLETREGRIAGWCWGRGETVFLLHGWGGHAGQLTPFVEPLLAARFRVVAIDLPAHGESPGRQASIRHFSGAILDAAQPFAPLAGIVAHSFGGAATTLAFDRGLYARAAVFVAPPSRFGSFFARAAHGFGFGDAVRRRLERRAEEWVGLRFEEVEPGRLARHQDAPLLILHDRGDDEVPFAEGEELARRWPGARFAPTEGLGHYRILRDPQVVAAGADFLERAAR